ncbi:UDP-4-amino-4,6-dideoxy-N-acetyl-beta-L-altrosamine N-acetyltransferase [bacterium]|nr:UDP-4-amino-4,6-dideoxy-N-acetyl-beta-L-altrosamine N-acetyltransferase [bacterium]
MSDSVRTIRLVPLASLNAEQQLDILAVRNQPSIRQWMYTSHEISEQEHRAWLGRVADSASDRIFVVLENNKVQGVVSANRIDSTHQRCDWAFYLDANARGGLGSTLEYHFINYVFDVLGMEKLNCEVIEGNDPVIALHQRFGFVHEGTRLSEVVRVERRVGVCYLGLTRTEWLKNKDVLSQNLEELLLRFDLVIEV